ncbi:hypothetical protein EV361DRAFT_932056 [Lentinula raphanica]|nr:hypothetical protein EV361DRAFT_932056 [Lentinula raphanica]
MICIADFSVPPSYEHALQSRSVLGTGLCYIWPSKTCDTVPRFIGMFPTQVDVAANRAPPPTVATQAPSPTVAQAPSPAIAQATPPATETFTITYWFRPVLEWEMPAEVESELGPTTREESQKWTRDLISRIFRSMGLDPPINNQENVKFMGDAQNWHFQLSTFDVVLLKDKDGWRVAAQTTETDDTVIRVWGMSMVNVIASDSHGVKENQVIFQEWDDATNRFRTVAQFRIPWNEQDEKMVREFREATARALARYGTDSENESEAKRVKRPKLVHTKEDDTIMNQDSLEISSGNEVSVPVHDSASAGPASGTKGLKRKRPLDSGQ